MIRSRAATGEKEKSVQHPATFQEGLAPMPAQQILQEAMKLYKVSESLKGLAIQDAELAEALTIMAGTVRNSANLLEVLVTLRLGSEQLLDSTCN